MTNQEVIFALQEYIQMDNRLAQLLQEKGKLEKEIKHFEIKREAPKPKRPSKIRSFFTVLCFSSLFAWGSLALVAEFTSASNEILRFFPILMIALTCILTPIYYKRKDSEACAQFVKAGMQYKEWEQGKQTKLPLLQHQLDQVMNDGQRMYQKFQNAKLRTFLHADYLPYAKIILGYFQRGRVRDLTEAVNLLEQELREYRRDRATAAYREEMRQQAQAQTAAAAEAAEQGRKAKEAAHEAAFWGAAATFAASSIKKNIDDSGDYHVV